MDGEEKEREEVAKKEGEWKRVGVEKIKKEI